MIKKQGTLIKLAVFVLAVVFLLTLWLTDALEQTGSFLGVPVLSQSQWEAKSQSSENRAAFDPDVLRWYNGRVPYDSGKETVYLSQSMKNGYWQGTLSAQEGVEIYFLESPDMGDKGYCLWENISFRLGALKNGIWMEANVVFSGLPIVCLWGEADDSLSDFLLLDPDGQGGSGRAVRSNCTFHFRGSSTLTVSEPGIRVSLCTSDGGQVKKNLLGIRDDDDWILNSLYYDPGLLREKLSYDLWEQVNQIEAKPIKSSTITYVEVFRNDTHYGVYGLMPRLDGKQVGLKDGMMYKIRSYLTPTEENYMAAQNTDMVYDDQMIWPAVSIEYPNVVGQWDLMKTYYAFAEERDTSVLEDADIQIDESNVVAYNLFCNVIRGDDNLWKNMLLVFDRNADGSYKVQHTPWDLDLTYGTEYNILTDSEALSASRETPRESFVKTRVYAILEEENSEKIQKMTRQKWQQWKLSGITADSMCRSIDQEMDYLIRSGALMRHDSHYGELDYNETANQLKRWIRQRFDQIDAHIAQQAG